MTTSRRTRGFALLIVLWGLALLALFGTRITAGGRTDTRIARNLVDAATADALAEGALHEAAFHLLDPTPNRWQAGGPVKIIVRPEGQIAIALINPSGFVNPNSAPPQLMAALIADASGDQRDAPAIAAAIFDWRSPGNIAIAGGAKAPAYRAAGRDYIPPGKPFATLDEMKAVLGMTPALHAALLPYLSLYNFSTIDERVAPPPVRRALKASGLGQPALAEMPPVVLIDIVVTLRGGARASRRGVVMLSPADDGRPFRLLAWENGAY